MSTYSPPRATQICIFVLLQFRPQLSCGFTSLESLEQFFGNSVVLNGIEARGNFTDQGDLDAFFAKVNETDAQLSAAGQRCLDTDGSFLKYMGTVLSFLGCSSYRVLGLYYFLDVGCA